MKRKKISILKRIWRNDLLINLIAFFIPGFFVSFTAFRICYIKGRLFIGILLALALFAVSALVYYFILKRHGGVSAFAVKLRRQKPVYYSFIVASLITLFIFVIYKMAPFGALFSLFGGESTGNVTILQMDLYHQYGPLFAELYDKVAQGKSLLYSWNSAGGSGFLGNFFNYLSSPFTFLIFWTDKLHVIDVIGYMSFLKCIFSACTFTFFLNKHFKTKSLSTVAFGQLYAFCAYFIAYHWNLMWLDSMLLFPIIILGIERIIDRNKTKTYFFALILTFITNYYMAYMVCIFSVLYFVVYYLSNYKIGELYIKKTPELSRLTRIKESRLLNAGVRFALTSLAAALVCAVTLLPVYFSLKSSSATANDFPAEFERYFDIFDFFTAHIAALDPTIRSSGGNVTPNIYCGILSIVLFPLYFMNKRIAWKQKLMNFLLLAFLFVCVNVNITNYIWHGFHFPNDLPYRFSFMYSFILLVIAFNVFRYIKDYDFKTLVIVGGALIFMTVIAEKYDLRYVTRFTIYTTLAFIIVYSVILAAASNKKLSGSLLAIVLCCAVSSEIFICDIPQFGFSVTSDSYTDDYNSYRKVIDEVKNSDDGIYRIELSDIPSELRMSPCWYDYEGISCFTSMANEKTALAQFRLGNFSNKINSYMYHNQTPVYNAMFNIKYVLDNNNSIKMNKKYYSYTNKSTDGIKVLKNNFNSYMGYAVNKALLNYWNIEFSKNPFDNQNDFIKYATGTDENVFTKIDVRTSGTDNCSLSSVNIDESHFAFKAYEKDSDASFDVKFSANETANYFVYAGTRALKNIEYKTDSFTKTQEINTEPYILDLGELKKGQDVNLSCLIDSEASSNTAYIWVYKLNDDVFNKAYNNLCDGGQFKVSEKTDTYLKGTVKTDKKQLLYTSITYDKGWHAYVDGEEVQISPLQGAFICIETGEGEHTVEFKYSPAGLKPGIIISACTVSALFLWVLIKKRLYNFLKAITVKKNKPNINDTD